MTGAAEVLLRNLRGAQSDAAEAIAAAVLARDQIAQAVRLFRECVRGSSQAVAHAASAHWEAAGGELDRMIGRLLAGSHDIDTYIAQSLGAYPPGRAGTGEPFTITDPTEGGTARQRRLARLRDYARQRPDDIGDLAKEGAALVPRGLSGPEPGGRPVVSAPATPAATPAKPPPVATPDIVMGVVVSAIVASEAGILIAAAARRASATVRERLASIRLTKTEEDRHDVADGA